MKAIAKKPGHTPAPDSKVILELIQYNENDFVRQDNIPVEEIIGRLKPDYINWVNVDGLHDQGLIDKLSKHFCIHPLLIEDITSDHQPKTEEYDDYLFFTLKMLYRIENGVIDYEQISF